MGNELTAMEMVNKTLKHYGVRGMKWGVIRRKTRGGGYVTVSADGAAARATLSSPAKAVSSADIQSAINRMRLESQFSELQSALTPPTRTQRAKRYVGKLLGDIGNEQLTRVAKASASIAVEQALQKGGDVKLDRKFAEQVGKRLVPKKK